MEPLMETSLRYVWCAEEAARNWIAGPGPLPEQSEAIRPESEQANETFELLDRWPSSNSIDALFDLSLAVSVGVGEGEFRRVPSAGGRHPVVAYVDRDGNGYDRYDPLRHALIRSACRSAPSTGQVTGPFGVLLGVDRLRTERKYGRRSLPSLLLDTGHAVGGLAVAGHVVGEHMLVDLWSSVSLPSGGIHHLATVADAQGQPAFEDFGAQLEPEKKPVCIDDPSDVVGLALHELTTHSASSGFVRVPIPHVSPEALVSRRSASFAYIESAPRSLLEDAGMAAFRALDSLASPACAILLADCAGLWLANSRGWVQVGSGDPRPALARWACGQSPLASIDMLLVTHGRPGESQSCATVAPVWPSVTLAEYRLSYLAAGVALHLAHVRATMLGASSRPVGCWGDAASGADLGAALGAAPGSISILHGLAIGIPPC